MRYCYVVTGATDSYAAMAAVSVASLRRVHPNAEVHLFFWPKAGNSPVWKQLSALATAVHVPLLPGELDAKSASRLIKITLRQRIDGSLLYLDSDTLVIRSLDELSSPRCIGMVLDRWVDAPRPGLPGWAKELYETCGWRFPRRNYFNGGVMALPDNPDAHKFSQDWQARWEIGRTKAGVNLDQPSLNAVVAAWPELPIKILEDRFNALVDADPRLAAGAHVLHFFAGGTRRGIASVFDRMVSNFGENGTIDWASWERVLEEGWPLDSPRPAAWRLSADYAFRSVRQLYINFRYELDRRRRRVAGAKKQSAT